MAKYVVHFARTEFYDVPVEADDENEAWDRAEVICGPEHLDKKAGRNLELADWTSKPIEMVEE